MKVLFDRFVVLFVLIFAVNTGYAAENLEKTEEAVTNKPLTLTEAYTVSETFDVGEDLSSQVSLDYIDRAPFRFKGKIEKINIRYLDSKYLGLRRS